MLLAINTFHDSEHFIDTAILNDMVSEQADMIYEYCIDSTWQEKRTDGPVLHRLQERADEA
mgnify:CR=1 FL=1